MISRIQINRALNKKNCHVLVTQLIDSLNKEDFKKGINTCLKKKQYKYAFNLWKYLESVTILTSEKQKIWIKRGFAYKKISKYSRAIADFKKILKADKNNHNVRFALVESFIYKKFFKQGIQHTSFLLLQNLKNPFLNQVQFAHGRILFFLKKRKEAIAIFNKIKKTSPRFFEESRGSFYLALLLEEEKAFDLAIKELQEVKWPFSKLKTKHWKHRDKNAPGVSK